MSKNLEVIWQDIARIAELRVRLVNRVTLWLFSAGSAMAAFSIVAMIFSISRGQQYSILLFIVFALSLSSMLTMAIAALVNVADLEELRDDLSSMLKRPNHVEEMDQRALLVFLLETRLKDRKYSLSMAICNMLALAFAVAAAACFFAFLLSA